MDNQLETARREHQAATVARFDDLEAYMHRLVLNAMFAVYINVDSPGGEIAGRNGLMRELMRRRRAKRYSRSPAWRHRARKGGLR